MEQRPLGPSKVEVTKVALGAWAIGGWLWGGTDDEKAVAGIRRALDLGMTTIDTAAVYGFGHSETIVGRAVKGRREEVQLLTKFGLRWDLQKGVEHFDTEDSQGRPVRIHKYAGRKSVLEECDRSLQRLGTDCIDLFQQHWPDPSTPIEETMDSCARLLKAGKIRAVGVSNYSVQQMEEARKVVPLASDQPPYSMLKRDIEENVLPWCRERGVGVLAYSPLQNGLLTGKVTLDREFPATDLRSRSPYFTRENRQRVLKFLDAIRPIAARYEATLAQLVIAWTVRQPGITAALVGVRNVEQAEENAAAGDLNLSDADLAAIDERLAEVRLQL